MPVQIFIPFYGEPSLLKLTVASVLAQSDPGWTLTVVGGLLREAGSGSVLPLVLAQSAGE